MKKVSFIKNTVAFLAAVLMLFIACSDSVTHKSNRSYYTMKVTGTEGVEFTANIGGASIVNGISGEKLTGTVPAEYTMNGGYVGGIFRKHSDKGTLKVEIIRDGQILAQSETSIPKGVLVLEAMK